MTAERTPRRLVDLDDFDDSAIAAGKAVTVDTDGETFILTDSPTGGGGGVSAMSYLTNADMTGMKTANFPLTDLAVPAAMTIGYLHLFKLRCEEDHDFSKIGVFNWTFSSLPSTMTASFWSISGLTATRVAHQADASPLYAHLRGRKLDVGATYSHTGADEVFAVGLYVATGTAPSLYHSALNETATYRDDADTDQPWPGIFPPYCIVPGADDTTTSVTLTTVGVDFYFPGTGFFWIGAD